VFLTQQCTIDPANPLVHATAAALEPGSKALSTNASWVAYGLPFSGYFAPVL